MHNILKNTIKATDRKTRNTENDEDKMLVNIGECAVARKESKIKSIQIDTQKTANGHMLLIGMSGAGKTYTLRKIIGDMEATATNKADLRISIFDRHGDIRIEGASSMSFSEQSNYGLNPLKIDPDPHFGGVRKRVQRFISNMNRVMRQLGGKQEACLRNILYDLYTLHGFKQDDPATWTIDEREDHLLSDGSDGRLYLAVPIGEKDQAKALGARWDPEKTCWWVPADIYKDGLTRWPPKRSGRTNPTLEDALNLAKRILKMSFMGADQEAITYLDIHNRASTNYHRKVTEGMRRGAAADDKEKMDEEIEKSLAKVLASYTKYAQSIRTGRELDDVMKYDSTDVLKSVVDRLENLVSTGIYKSKEPPFDKSKIVWRYVTPALNPEENKLFTLFSLEESFANAVKNGEQDHITHVIILDEAHLYSDDDPDNIINTIAKEARKFGMALICASQNPTHFSDDFLSCVATKIILGIDEMYWRPSSVKMRITEDYLKWIKLTKTAMVQIKNKGSNENIWQPICLQ